jgi:hypothetical protein
MAGDDAAARSGEIDDALRDPTDRDLLGISEIERPGVASPYTSEVEACRIFGHYLLRPRPTRWARGNVAKARPHSDAPAPGVVVILVGSGMVLAIDDQRRRLDGEVQTPGLRLSRTKAN